MNELHEALFGDPITLQNPYVLQSSPNNRIEQESPAYPEKHETSSTVGVFEAQPSTLQSKPPVDTPQPATASSQTIRTRRALNLTPIRMPSNADTSSRPAEVHKKKR